MKTKNNNEPKKKKYIHPTRIFKSPQDLLNAWEEYKKHRNKEAEKWKIIQYVGRDGQRVEHTPPMPYDLDGFVAWYYQKYGRFIHQYFEKVNEYEEEFLGIVTHILKERNDNIKTGTLLGFFNSSMGNRITGLADKLITENKNIQILNIDPLDDSADHSTKKDSSTQETD